jgi:hypothetical protein
MSPTVRKSLLTVHVTFSVGWLGAVVAYLVLALVAVLGSDPTRSHAAYRTLEIVGWWAIVPCCAVAFVSGVVQALVTEWGLFRHTWIVVKLGLTAFATVILLFHLRSVGGIVARAMTGASPAGHGHGHGPHSLIVHAVGGLVVLLAITAISFFKPWGRFRGSP